MLLLQLLPRFVGGPDYQDYVPRGRFGEDFLLGLQIYNLNRVVGHIWVHLVQQLLLLILVQLAKARRRGLLALVSSL
jgi:hypothetical protein